MSEQLSNQPKSILASRTVWGASIAIVAAGLGLFGYAMGPADQSQTVDLVADLFGLWDRMLVIGGSALAIWGRVKATRRIG